MMKGGVIILFGFVVLQFAFLSAKSELAPSPSPVQNLSQNYIVYISEPTTQGESPEQRSLRILSSVFPRKAAEDALIYVFKAITGFVATITSHQAILLKEQAEVLNVVRDGKYHLHLGTGKGRHGGISPQPELGE